MSPVPEPMQGDREGPNNGDDEGIIPPVGLTMGPPMSSSDEEADQMDPNDHSLTGYQPLPQDFDDENDESAIDYSSLSGLMAALNTHGPNVVEGETDVNEPQENDHSVEESLGERGISSGTSSGTVDTFQQSQSRREESKERAAIWNSPQEDRLSLDGNKVEEIKSAMASFTLPQSAIPSWAQNISDEDWKNQIAGILSKKDSQ